MEVCTTRWAFLENHSVSTMIKPDRSRKIVAALLPFSARLVIIKVSPSVPLAMKSRTASRAASGTPTKFTKSLPANAKASEKVPLRMTIRKMLKLIVQSKMENKMDNPMKSVKRMAEVLASIHAIHSGCMKLAPLAPFMTRK